MKYFFRNTIDVLTTPMMVLLILLAFALVLRWRGHRRASLVSAATGLALLYLCALPPVSSALLAPLESPYHTLDDAHLPQGIAGIAVLGAAYVPRENAPITAEIPGDGLARVAEGVRLARRYGNVRLVLSGGAPSGYGVAPSAHGYAIFAREMGIDPASITVLDWPLNTADEAQALSRLFGKSPFLLVTSASHMMRAMKLLERTGAHPIPAPTWQRSGRTAGLSRWLPRSANLGATEAAVHEYLGLLAMGVN